MDTNAHLSTRCPKLNGDDKSSIPPTATWLLPPYGKHNPSHIQGHTLPSQPSQLLITQFHLNTHNLSTSLAAPKANPIFHAANKTIHKTHFDYRHISSSSSPLYSQQTLSKEITHLARKRLNVNTHIRYNHSSPKNKPTFPR